MNYVCGSGGIFSAIDPGEICASPDTSTRREKSVGFLPQRLCIDHDVILLQGCRLQSRRRGDAARRPTIPQPSRYIPRELLGMLDKEQRSSDIDFVGRWCRTLPPSASQSSGRSRFVISPVGVDRRLRSKTKAVRQKDAGHIHDPLPRRCTPSTIGVRHSSVLSRRTRRAPDFGAAPAGPGITGRSGALAFFSAWNIVAVHCCDGASWRLTASIAWADGRYGTYLLYVHPTTVPTMHPRISRVSRHTGHGIDKDNRAPRRTNIMHYYEGTAAGPPRTSTSLCTHPSPRITSP